MSAPLGRAGRSTTSTRSSDLIVSGRLNKRFRTSTRAPIIAVVANRRGWRSQNNVLGQPPARLVHGRTRARRMAPKNHHKTSANLFAPPPHEAARLAAPATRDGRMRARCPEPGALSPGWPRFHGSGAATSRPDAATCPRPSLMATAAPDGNVLGFAIKKLKWRANLYIRIPNLCISHAAARIGWEHKSSGNLTTKFMRFVSRILISGRSAIRGPY
jgi:hypothetical protein